MADVTFPLSRPILTHKGDELKELVLKSPVARSFIRHGIPFTLADNPNDMKFDMKAVFGFVEDMTGVMSFDLQTIPGEDVLPLCYTLVGIIGNRPQIG